jgi:hypothetical protein
VHSGQGVGVSAVAGTPVSEGHQTVHVVRMQVCMARCQPGSVASKCTMT